MSDPIAGTTNATSVPAKQAPHLLTIVSDNDKTLADHTEAIRAARKRAAANILDIGHRLTECKKLVRHGDWGSWLKKEFGWSADTAENLTRVYAIASDFEQNGEFRDFRNLAIPASCLYLISKRSTPPEVRERVLKDAEAGKPVTVKSVKTAINKANASTKNGQVCTNTSGECGTGYLGLLTAWLHASQVDRKDFLAWFFNSLRIPDGEVKQAAETATELGGDD